MSFKDRRIQYDNIIGASANIGSVIGGLAGAGGWFALAVLVMPFPLSIILGIGLLIVGVPTFAAAGALVGAAIGSVAGLLLCGAIEVVSQLVEGLEAIGSWVGSLFTSNSAEAANSEAVDEVYQEANFKADDVEPFSLESYARRFFAEKSVVVKAARGLKDSILSREEVPGNTP